MLTFLQGALALAEADPYKGFKWVELLSEQRLMVSQKWARD